MWGKQVVISKYGKTYDLIMRLLDGYKKLGYIVFMDNFSTGLDLFYDLLIEEKTAACGTMRLRKGVLKNSLLQSLNSGGEYKVMSYNHKIIGMRLP